MREEKKLNEAEELIGDADLEIGETRQESTKMTENRIIRAKELINQRKEEGLSTNSAVIDALLDEEELETKKNKRRVEILLYIGIIHVLKN